MLSASALTTAGRIVPEALTVPLETVAFPAFAALTLSDGWLASVDLFK